MTIEVWSGLGEQPGCRFFFVGSLKVEGFNNMANLRCPAQLYEPMHLLYIYIRIISIYIITYDYKTICMYMYNILLLLLLLLLSLLLLLLLLYIYMYNII